MISFNETDRNTVESSEIKDKNLRSKVAEIAQKAVKNRLNHEKAAAKYRSRNWIKPTHKRLAKQLFKIRKQEGLSVRQAADKAGTKTFYWISNIENLKSSPNLTKVNHYVESLGYKMEINIVKK